MDGVICYTLIFFFLPPPSSSSGIKMMIRRLTKNFAGIKSVGLRCNLKENHLERARPTSREEQAVLRLGENDLSTSFQSRFAYDPSSTFETHCASLQNFFYHTLVFL